MLETVITLVTNASLFDTAKQWLFAVTSVVTASSAIVALTPTKKDDAIRTKILQVLNFLALNVGNAGGKRKMND